jgi:hypothetical protein
MIHSIIYYYIFVKKAYVKIIELYDTLIKPDEYIRDIIIKLFGNNIIINSDENVNKELIKLFQYISYAGEINIEKAKYTVIDLSIDDKKSELKNFEENMVDINKHFNYKKYNHEANYYTKIFFEDFKELFLKEMLLKGIYSAETVSFSFKVLEKAFDKITPENTSENTFKEIYQELFKKVNKNQPITSKKMKKCLFFHF